MPGPRTKRKNHAANGTGKFRQMPWTLTRKNVDGSLAVISLNTHDKFFVLDGIVAETWLLMKKPISLNQIKLGLKRKYSQIPPRFDHDIEKVVNSFCKKNLIEAK